MSDFLTNVAARTIASPPMRPRTRMRFEPTGPAPELVDETALETPEGPRWPSPSVRSAIEGRGDAAADTSAAAPHPAPSPEHEAVADSSDRGIPTTPSAIQRASPGAPMALKPGPATSPQSATHDEASSAHEWRVVAPVQNALANATTIAVLESGSRTTALASRAAAAGVEVATETGHPRPHRYDEEPARTGPTRDETTRLDAARMERGGRRSRRASGGREAFTSTRLTNSADAKPPMIADETVVHVSIGRIEVRAPAPAAAPQAPKRSTAMSIDDYVARRRDHR